MTDANWKRKTVPDCNDCENCEDCTFEHDTEVCGAKLVTFTVNFFEIVKEEDWIELMLFDEYVKHAPYAAMHEKFENETNCHTNVMDFLETEQYIEISDKIMKCSTNEEILKEVKDFFEKNNIKYEFELYGYSLNPIEG